MLRTGKANQQTKEKQTTPESFCFQEASFEAAIGFVMLFSLHKIFSYLNSVISVKNFFFFFTLERMTYSVCILVNILYSCIFLLLALSSSQKCLYLSIFSISAHGHHLLLSALLQTFSIWLFFLHLCSFQSILCIIIRVIWSIFYG